MGKGHIPHFFRTPRPTRRARVPRGARAALGDPEASQGGLPRSPQVSTPSPSWETSSAPSFEGAATDSSLRAGADNCLSAPCQRPAPAAPGPEPATRPLHPHCDAESPQSCPDSPDLAFPWVPRICPGVGPASAGGISLVQGAGRSLWSSQAHGGREAAAREGVQIQRGPRRLHPQARPASLLGDGETSPAPTFRGEEAAPPAAPAAAAAAPHAQHQQERYPAQPPSHHPRRRRRLRAAAATAAAAYCPRRLSPSGVRRASGRLVLPLCALRAPPRSASGARRRAASSPSAAALTGADPEQLRRSPQDGP